MKKLIIAILFLSSTALAQTKVCDLCKKIDAVEKVMAKKPEAGLSHAIELMSRERLSKDASMRSQEIQKLLKLAVKVIPKNDSGESDEYLLFYYKEDPKEFDKQIEKLPAADKKIIKDSLKQSEKVQKHGNG